MQYSDVCVSYVYPFQQVEGALQNVNLNRTLESVLAPSPGYYHQYLMMMLMMRWIVDSLETEELATVILHDI